MPDLKRTRSWLTVAVAILAALDLIALAVLLTPIAGSADSRQQQMDQLWRALKSRESAPWRGLDKKIPEARTEIADFYRDRLPDTYSAISTNLDKLGIDSGVKVSGEKYEEKDAAIEGLQRVEIQADVSGGYLQLVKFINSLERNKLFFMVDGLQLASEQSGNVKLQIRLETYLRTT